jgi:hypothetical protein
MNKFKIGSFIYKNAHFLQLGINSLAVLGIEHYRHVYDNYIPTFLNHSTLTNPTILLVASVYSIISLTKIHNRISIWHNIANSLIEKKSFNSNIQEDNIDKIKRVFFYTEDDNRNKLNLKNVSRQLKSHLSNWDINYYQLIDQPIKDELLKDLKNKPYLAMSLIADNDKLFEFLWQINHQKFNEKDLLLIKKMTKQIESEKKFVDRHIKGKSFCNTQAINELSKPEIFQTLPDCVQDFLLSYTTDEKLSINKKELLKNLKGEIVSYFSNNEVEKLNKKNLAEIEVQLDKIAHLEIENKNKLLNILKTISEKQLSTLEYFTLSNSAENLEKNYFVKNSLNSLFSSIKDELEQIIQAQLVTKKEEALKLLQEKVFNAINMRIGKINEKYETIEITLLDSIGQKIDLQQKTNIKSLKL